MAKKATIDLLDIEPDLEKDMPPRAEAAFEASDAAGKGKKGGRLYALLRRLRTSRWKLPVVFAVVLLLLAAAGASVWFFHFEAQRKAAISREREALDKASPAARQAGLFDHFVIDVHGPGGDIRLMLCDVFVAFENPQVQLTQNDRLQIRTAIQVLLKQTVKDGANPADIRNQIKTGLKAELNRMLGEGTVKNIYLPRYEVI